MSRPVPRLGPRLGSRPVPLLALLLAGAAAAPASARPEGASPFPGSTLAPSPYTRGVKSSSWASCLLR